MVNFHKGHKYKKIFRLSLLIAVFFLLRPITAAAWLIEADSINLAAVSSGSTTFQTVNLRQTYISPPLVFVLPGHENPQPAAIRIRNITTTTFEIAQVEPAGEDGDQPASTINYLAIEPGTHAMANGTIFEAGSVNTTRVQHGSGLSEAESYETINFASSFATTPAVIAQIQTMNNETAAVPGAPSSPWLTTAIIAASTNVQLALERSEDNTAGDGAIAANETIAYLAISAGANGSFVDTGGTSVTYESMQTTSTIRGWDDSCTTFNFITTYPAPIVVANKNSHNGGDGGWLRRCAAVNTSNIGITVDEDQTQNAERNHTTEQAGVIIFSQGFDGDIAPLPTADYHFDACDLSGGTVTDAAGTYHGSVSGLVNTTDDAGGVCKVGEFSGGTVDLTGLPVTTSAGAKTTVMFWMYWDGSDNEMPFGWQRHDLWLRNNHFGFNTGNADIYGINNAVSTLANGWHHIAAVFHNGDVSQEKLYIDGIPQTLSQQQSSPNNSVAYVNSNARISGWLNDNNYRFTGRLDELMIYNAELSAIHINNVMNNQLAAKNYDGSPRICDLCLAPVAEYLMNECQWNSTPNEVTDTSGNNLNGTAYGATTTSTAHQCRAGDFSANSVTDYLSLNHLAADGLADFSVSTWIKTANSGSQAILSGAGATNNEMLMWLNNSTTFMPFINNVSGNISIPNIADDIWHHLVWTRTGTQNCLYLDNSLSGCTTINKPDPVIIASGGLIIAQEQDSIGDNFALNQDFEGQIDDLRIFDKVLNTTEINGLYSEILTACNSCLPAAAEYRFDECSWNGTAGEVADEQGVANGVRVGNATPVGDGHICQGGQFDGDGDYINTGDSLNNVLGTSSNAFTVTAWVKPGNLDPTAQPSNPNTNHLTENTFIAKASDPVNDNLEIGVNANGSVHLYIDTQGQDKYADFGVAGDISLNNWNFIAATYDNGVVTVTINNNTYTNNTTWSGGGNLDNATGSPFTIGASIHIDNFFIGNIDEVKVYGTALNTAAITGIKTETRPLCQVCSIPVNDWRFDECDISSGIFTDSIGINDGTINGAVANIDDSGALCKVGTFNGGTVELNGLPISTTTGDKTTVTFWMYWDGSDNMMPFGWFQHDLWLRTDNFGFNTANSDIYGISGAAAKLANGWHHIAAVFVNGDVSQEKLYIDGLPQIMAQRLSSPINSRAYVQTSARISGWTRDNGYRFRSRLDEVTIYNGALTAGEISSIYGNLANGANYDGSIRACNLCTLPVAAWDFNECLWDGTANEVVDSGPNGYDGTASGATTSPVGKVCRSGDFSSNSTSDYVDLDYRAANGLNDFTVSSWIKTANSGNQAILSGAGPQANEMLMWLSNSTTFTPFINGSNGTIAIPNIADDTWHHIAWTRTGTQNCAYVDNVFRGCVTINKPNPLIISNGGLIVGQEQDTVGDNFDINQDFEGLIDQLKIYDSVLSASEISALYTETPSGCNSCQTPVADWRFDDCSPAGTITDYSGNGYDGLAENGADTVSGGILCRAGNFDGVDNRIRNTWNQTFNNAVTLMAWIKTTGGHKAYARVVEFSNAAGDYQHSTALAYDAGGTTIRGWTSNAGGTRSAEVSYNLTANGFHDGNWHLLSYVYDGSTANLYVDGIIRATTATNINSIQDGRTFVIGSYYPNSNYTFNGNIDEVQIYDQALAAGSIQTIYNNQLAGNNYDGFARVCNAACGATVDHYEIRHDGSAITCNPEDVTIAACADAACASNYTGNVSLTLSPAGWTGGDNKSFSGGTATYQLFHALPETVSLALSAPSPAPTNPTTCLNTSTGAADCSLTYFDTGFIFNIPPQTSCQISPPVTISAVRMDLTSQQCTPSFSNRTENINFWSTYINPATGIKSLNINGSSISTSSPGTPVPLAFDANGEASFNIAYFDAGSMQLNSLFTGSGPEAGLIMQGNDTFVVKPAQLTIRASDPSNTDLDGSVTWPAGDNFTFAINATCADATTITANYAPNADDRIRMRIERTDPTGPTSQDRTFTINGTGLADSTSPPYVNAQIAAANFTNGSFIDNQAQYNDVGMLNIAVRDWDYFGETINSPAGGLAVGRFIPDHIEVNLTPTDPPIFANACILGALPNYTYLGEPFNFTSPLAFNISAQDKNNNITVNYEAALWHLPTSYNLTYTDTTAPVALTPATGTTSIADISDCNGQISVTANDTFTYQRPAVTSPEPPFATATTNFTFAISQAQFTDSINNSVCYDTGTGCQSFSRANISGGLLRHGRLKIFHNFGPETEDITNSPFAAQYFDGINWITNGNDSCTNTASLIFCPAARISSMQPDPLAAGLGTFTVSTSNTFGEQLLVCPTAPAWLSELNDCSIPNTTCGEFTFGVYRGNDRIINWQEIVR